MPTDHAFQALSDSVQLKVESSIEGEFQSKKKFQLNSTFNFRTTGNSESSGFFFSLQDERLKPEEQ